jgi:hypothetical protein
MTKIIEILSQQGKYKILTHEEYELLSHRKLSVKKEDSVFGQFPTGYNTSTPREVGDEVTPRLPPPTPLRKYFHAYSGINDVKPKVSFNLGREIPDMAGSLIREHVYRISPVNLRVKHRLMSRNSKPSVYLENICTQI